MPMPVSKVSKSPVGSSDELLMTTPQAAAYLQVHPSTLANWRKAGFGPRFVRFGAHFRYRKGDVDTWFEDQRQTCCVA